MTLPEISTRIEILRSRLDSIRPLNPEQERRIMDKFRLDWNYHSNHLEGNTLTYGETKALLLFNITAQGKPLKDHLEIKGHNEAILWIEEVARQKRPLTENFIRELHQLLLKEPYQVDAITQNGQPTKRWVQVGQYKTAPNHVKTQTGEIFRFATPEEIPALMHDLIEWYRNELTQNNTGNWLLAAIFHYKFIRIHPFDDGNGRLARILMNFILMQQGFAPAVIKTGEKGAYFRALEQADTGNLEAFIIYIGEQLAYSLDLMIRGAMGQEIEEEDDLDKQIALLKANLEANKNEEVRLKKSWEVVQSTYDQSIEPLLKAVELKIITFDELFAERKSVYIFNEEEIPVNTNFAEYFRWLIYREERGFVDPLTGEAQDVFGQPNTPANSIKVIYNWRGFKKLGIRAFNVHTELSINFDEFKYSILLKNNPLSLIEKLYHESLSREEIKQLANELAKQVLTHIQESLKR